MHLHKFLPASESPASITYAFLYNFSFAIHIKETCTHPLFSGILEAFLTLDPMANRRLSAAISRLETTQKWILFSAVLVGLSTILPWYEDLDAFGAGDLYLGITGPLFLVGLMVFASAAMVAYWIVAPAMGKRVPSLPIKDGALFTFLGLQDLMMLLVANSVFFHPKFGVNITLKNTQFGMVLAAIGVLFMIWSGYRLYRKEETRSSSIGSEGRLEPLIRMPEKRPVASMERLSVKESHAVPDRDPSHYGGSTAAIGAHARGPVEHAVDRISRDVRETRDEQIRKEPIEHTSGTSAPQPLRMDL